MLIDFSLENFRSIKEEMTLSLLATKDRSLPNNTFSSSGLKKGTLLKSVVLYGANASGKTNIIRGLNVMQYIVLNSHNFQKDAKLPYEPFKLDSDTLDQPTSFRVVIIINNVRYLFGFSYTSSKIIDEYLYHFPKNRKALIFHRKNTNEYKFANDKRNQNFLSEKTPQNVLYISRATQLNYLQTSIAYDWFKETLFSIGPADHPTFQDMTLGMLENEDDKQVILKSLEEADFGINDLSYEKRKISLEEFKYPIPDEFKKLFFKDNELIEETKIQSFHKGIPFDFITEESSGTQRMFSLIGAWIKALRDGKVLVVDELDVKLHHLLSKFLVQLFHDESQNINRGQLIFTTHDINLLDQDLFRRDQIWFTEKNPSVGSTELYSLVEFKPRKDKNIRNGYLNGRYGAVPFISEKRIFKHET